ncbi:MAG: adenylate kinase, partial [Candidatus Omnitrophica bacterium]|nr:adenylate kinase [Candidatus Omnitrophota bacterium]
LEIADEKIIERVLNRLICTHCHAPYHLTFKAPRKAGICDICGNPLHKRPDDISEMLRVRQRAFQRVIKPVLEYYQQSRRLLVINADGPMEKVSAEIVAAVQSLQNQERRADAPTEPHRAPVIVSGIQPPARNKEAKTACHLILVGAPGSGKGTQAEALRDTFQLAHIATGDLFRENLKNQTDLGKLAKSYMDRGELVPDDVTEAMVEDRLAKSPPDSGFILDGFPRTLPQANALTEILSHFERHLDAALYIKVPDAVIENRLSGRRVCRKCQTPYHLLFKQPAQDGVCDLCGGELYQRDDDNPRTIRSRLETFHLQTTPIIKYYQDAGVLFEIDGQGDVAAVTRSSLAVIKTIQDSLR